MQGEQIFFQLAATLIPVFLFVGAVSQRLHPGPWLNRRGRTFAALVLAMAIALIPVLAEATAINAALGSHHTSSFDRWLVALTLCAATVAACLSVIWPLLDALDRRLGGKFRIVIALGAVAVAVSSAWVLDSGVKAAVKLQQFERMDEALDHVTGPAGRQLRRAHDEEVVSEALESTGVDSENLVRTLVSPSPVQRLRRAVGQVPGPNGAYAKELWAVKDIADALIAFGIDRKSAAKTAKAIVHTRPGPGLRALLEGTEALAIARSLGIPRHDLGELLLNLAKKYPGTKQRVG